jgi:uncharacterized protein YceH (UPF0502 family)
MVDFDDLGSVEHDLELMANLGGGLVERLPRRPGQKEERWAQLLADHEGSTGQAPAPGPEAMSAPMGEDGEDPSLATEPAPPPSEPLAELRDEVTALRSEVEGLRSELIELRASLGG